MKGEDEAKTEEGGRGRTELQGHEEGGRRGSKREKREEGGRKREDGASRPKRGRTELQGHEIKPKSSPKTT